MSDWSGQFDVTHALTTNGGLGDFHATLVTNDALITDLLILTTVTLPVFGRAKNFFGEQALLFWLLGAVVDGFWLADFAVRPFTHDFW